MSAKQLLECVNFVDLALCMGLLSLLVQRRAFSEFRFVGLFLAVRALSSAICIPIIFFRKEIGISKMLAYKIFMVTFWSTFVLQIVLMVLAVYGIYALALKPMAPLRDLGMIIFRWVVGISVAISIGVAIGPHMLGHTYAATVVAQLQQSVCVLTLCLLLFVCFALRPLGITFQSRLFGMSLGLGIIAAVYLVQSAWLPTNNALSVYSPIYLYTGLATCCALVVWGAYLVMPEPKRRMVLLPTTSPYFFWNKISEALGDAPGFVAISGFTPDSLAPAELEALAATEDVRDERGPQIMQPIAVNR